MEDGGRVPEHHSWSCHCPIQRFDTVALQGVLRDCPRPVSAVRRGGQESTAVAVNRAYLGVTGGSQALRWLTLYLLDRSTSETSLGSVRSPGGAATRPRYARLPVCNKSNN